MVKIRVKSDDDIQGRRVAIVGGGMAGLACAHELRQRWKDADITLIEQHYSMGGNVKTLMLPDGKSLDMGVIELFPWYYNVFKLLTALGYTDDELQPIPTENLLYESPSSGSTAAAASTEVASSASRYPYALRFIRPFQLTRRAVRLLGFLLRRCSYYCLSQARIVDQHKTMQDVLMTMYSDQRSQEYVESQTYLEAYTYPPPQHLSAQLYLPLTLRGMEKSYILRPNLSSFMARIVKSLGTEHTTIHRSTTVTRVQRASTHWELHTNQASHSVIAADIVVFAGPFGPLQRQALPQLTAFQLSYTCVYSVVAAFQDLPETQSTPWLGCFERRAASDPRPRWEILSFVRGSMVELPNVLVFYLIDRDPHTPSAGHMVEHIDHDQVSMAFAECLGHIPFLQSSQMQRILHIEPFTNCMPDSDVDLIRHIRDLQGHQGVYLAGQYLGHPSLETAAYTGRRVAAQMTGTLTQFDAEHRAMDQHWKTRWLLQPLRALSECAKQVYRSARRALCATSRAL